jgi:hypothetical protein
MCRNNELDILPTLATSKAVLGFNLGARYYEANSGKFLSPDPTGREASPTLFSFAAGDPVKPLRPTWALANGHVDE